MKNRYVCPQKWPQKRLGVQELILEPKITKPNRQTFIAKTMLDSGCMHTCINKQTVHKEHIPTHKLDKPILATNANGTPSRKEPITKFINLDLNIEGHQENINAVVAELDSADIFIGHDWLTKHNPEIDWKSGILEFSKVPKHLLHTQKCGWRRRARA